MNLLNDLSGTPLIEEDRKAVVEFCNEIYSNLGQVLISIIIY
jgi:hypothetical protein